MAVLPGLVFVAKLPKTNASEKRAVYRRSERTAMTDLGKLLVALGGMIILIGAALLLAGRFNLPLGRLPGDIVYRGKNSVFYFPLTTCIIVSVLLSLLFWLFGRGHR
jgi:ribose/xylose/arabinose/galactoside ABC-type transport system permease subunit